MRGFHEKRPHNLRTKSDSKYLILHSYHHLKNCSINLMVLIFNVFMVEKSQSMATGFNRIPLPKKSTYFGFQQES